MEAARSRSFILVYVDTSIHQALKHMGARYNTRSSPSLLLVSCARLAKLAMSICHNSDQLKCHQHWIFPFLHLTRRQDRANAITREGASHLGDHKHFLLLRRAFSLRLPFICCLLSSEATELTAAETAQMFRRTCKHSAGLKSTILQKMLGVVGTEGVPH